MQTINSCDQKQLSFRLINRKIYLIYEDYSDIEKAVEKSKCLLNDTNSCYKIVKIHCCNNISATNTKERILRCLKNYNKTYDTIFIIETELIQKLLYSVKKHFVWEKVTARDIVDKIQCYIEGFH